MPSKHLLSVRLDTRGDTHRDQEINQHEEDVSQHPACCLNVSLLFNCASQLSSCQQAARGSLCSASGSPLNGQERFITNCNRLLAVRDAGGER